MILNDYWNGSIVASDDNSLYILPRYINNMKRAKTINEIDFKDGDILIYDFKPIEDSNYTYENGTYAFIYLNGEFVGNNIETNNLNNDRNYFTYQYYIDKYTSVSDPNRGLFVYLYFMKDFNTYENMREEERDFSPDGYKKFYPPNDPFFKRPKGKKTHKVYYDREIG